MQRAGSKAESTEDNITIERLTGEEEEEEGMGVGRVN